MSFTSERVLFEEELDGHYATYPTDLAPLEHELHELSSGHPEWLPYTRKAAGYEILAQRCRVKVFRHSPFYFELDVGKSRRDLGAGGVGGWMKREPLGVELNASGAEWLLPCGNAGLSSAWPVLDDNHHGPGYDNVFRHGLTGLIQRAETRLDTAAPDKERAFLRATIVGTRGGRYEASLFSFRAFANLGIKTGATPDGRKAGEHLSPGMSPSLVGLGRECSIGQVIRSLEPLDLTLYPVVAVLDVKLPASCPPETLVSVFKRFVASGGSVLQPNVVNPERLVEAREHPERHPDLVVRVSGFSALFTTLSPAVQDEIINRTMMKA